MITIILIITGLIIGAVMAIPNFAKYHDLYSNERDTKEGQAMLRTAWRGVFIGVILLITAFVQPFTFERVDAGNVGIKIKLTGNSRGVSNYEYKTGWVMYNSWTEQMLEFPTFQQHIEYDDQVIITKGGFSASIKPSFNYSLKPTAIGDMFENLRVDIRQVEQGWLKNAIIGAVNDVSNTWEVDSIFTHRAQFEASIVVECNKRLTKWFNVSQLRTNITPPESLQEAIIAKTKSIQQAQAEEQRAIAAVATKRRKIAEAQADSAETIINATAASLAMKLKQTQLTPMYIEYVKWTNWDGKLPSTMTGNAGTLLNIK
jgi:regulator of protease activity HflC (stomatin/prohibitin superfamily)